MPNYIVTEYDTMVSVYKVNAIDKQDAINKIANGDYVKRASLRSKAILKEKTRRWYEAEEIGNGEEEKVQVISLPTQDQEGATG